ncbi:phage tail protein [Novosphingobium guangzhouense]|uniref:Phage tail collar domain-containing protein n=1 Tax=Novosphingobium guangzhouense TaxID=1850347 RepID=A0A2K2G606_9SPHN|nr:phage tail protein [Novosphingobium guangzhouense]PNU06473.1 hypothetical protein A8V01_02715 [Novosphingobium guangzhouense]
MPAFALKLTDAGLAAVQGEAGSDPVVLSHLGLTATPFDYAPTLTALPDEFKRIEVASGIAAAPNITHLTAYDTSTDVWSATGFGLFMADGVLFAVYTSPTVIMSKSEMAFALFALDIAFDSDLAANIEYGNAVFAYPPATEQTRGVARLATAAEAQAGEEPLAVITPATGKEAAPYWLADRDPASPALDADRLSGQAASWYMPPGFVGQFAMAAAPAGWLKCNGAAVSRADYPALFAAIGTEFGEGDGATTFNLPDIRGEFVRGLDDGRGIDPDRSLGSAQDDMLREHEHLIAANAATGGILTGDTYVALEGTAGGDTQYILHSTLTVPTLGRTSATGGSETRPRNVALLFCIKF